METKGYTQDGTVDLRGRPVLASKTGKWNACAFLLGKRLSAFSSYQTCFVLCFFSSQFFTQNTKDNRPNNLTCIVFHLESKLPKSH